MTGFVTPDPLNNLTNLFQRPEFIQADRTPTINDVKPPGTQWGDNVQPIQNIYETPGKGIWFLLGVGLAGPLNTINGVLPVFNNINLVNTAGLTISAGPPGIVNLGVNFDPATLAINGFGQLTVISAAPPLTLTGNAPSLPRLYNANNFNIQGTPTGAINFNSSAVGQMDVNVQYDNLTIGIDAFNQLTVVGSVVGVATTVAAVNADVLTITLTSPQVTTFDILVVGNDTTGSTGVGYSIFGTVRSTGGAAFLVGVPDKISNEEVSSIAADANLIVSGNTAIVRVLGVALKTINWKAIARSVSV